MISTLVGSDGCETPLCIVCIGGHNELSECLKVYKVVLTKKKGNTMKFTTIP